MATAKNLEELKPHTIAKNLKLNGYKLNLVKAGYYNGRLYLWLEDAKTGEHFADLTENHPEIDDKILQENIDPEQWERAIIDGDFIAYLGGVREAKIWIMDNIKNCLGGGEIDGLPALVLFNN